MPKRIRTNVTRADLLTATYFITTVTHRRNPIFADINNISLLRSTVRKAKSRHSFLMKGYAILPDHIHFLLQLEHRTRISPLIQSIKRNFTLNYKAEYEITKSHNVWQRSFYDHVIRDATDFANHLDYIHYNPVKHGLVKNPADYPHTSYLDYVEKGVYEIGWKKSQTDQMLNEFGE